MNSNIFNCWEIQYYNFDFLYTITKFFGFLNMGYSQFIGLPFWRRVYEDELWRKKKISEGKVIVIERGRSFYREGKVTFYD